MVTQITGGDVGDVLSNVLSRVSTLEQQITSPYFTVPAGSTPTFNGVNIGAWPDNGSAIPLSSLVGVPTNLAATAGASATDVYLDLTWLQPADLSAVSYQVVLSVKKADGTYSLFNTYHSISPQLHIPGLRPNTTYGVQVYSVNAIGVVSYPCPATGYYDVATVGDSSIPAQVVGLAGMSGATSVTIYWTDNTEVDVANGVGTYELQYDIGGTFVTPLQDVRVSGTVTSFTGLDPTKTYSFRVRAFDASGNAGPWSATLALTPGQAGGSQAASDGVPPTTSPTPSVLGVLGGLQASWTAITNADPVTYDVHLSTTSAFTPSPATLVMSTPATMAVILRTAAGAALVYGTTYYVRIVARDRDGSAPAGTQASGSPRQTGASDIVAGSITATQIAANTITANQIAAGTITATQIAAGSISADRLVAASITATQIAAGTITAAQIQAGSLTVDRLASSTLSAKIITLASDGQIIGGNNPTGTGSAQSGWILNGNGFNAFAGGVNTVRISGDGSAMFAGDITGASGTFSGNISGSTITGANIVGGSITAMPVPPSFIGANLVPNPNFDGYDPTTLAILNWNYITALGGTLYGRGPYLTAGTTHHTKLETTNPISGNTSMTVYTTDNTGGALPLSDPMAVTAGEVLTVRFDWKMTTPYRPMFAGMIWYDVSGTQLAITPANPCTDATLYNTGGAYVAAFPTATTAAGRTDVITSYTPGASGPYRVAGTVIVPTGAVFARMMIGLWTSPNASSSTCYLTVDNLSVLRTLENAQINGGVITASRFQTSAGGAGVILGSGSVPMYGNLSRGMAMQGTGTMAEYPSVVGADYQDSNNANVSCVVITGGSLSSTNVGYESQVYVYPRSASDGVASGTSSLNAGIMFAVGGSSSADRCYGQIIGQGAGRGSDVVYLQNYIGGSAVRLSGSEVDAVNWGGTGYISVKAQSYLTASDRNMKSGIRDLPFSALEAVRHAPAKMYRYRDDLTPLADQDHIGPMAQDLPVHLMKSVASNADHHPDTHWLSVTDLIGVLWAAVAELADHVKVPLSSAPAHDVIGNTKPPRRSVVPADHPMRKEAARALRMAHHQGVDVQSMLDYYSGKWDNDD